MKSVIFLAPPAAGKGTFSEYLIQKYNYVPISTGSLLREKATENKELANILESGELVSDDIIMDIVKEQLMKLDKNKSFLLDGVPRTLQQAKKLDIILSGLEIKDVVVIYIDVDKEVLIDRIQGRRTCMQCHRSYNVLVENFKPKKENVCDDCHESLVKREDDNLESFLVRYANYLERTYPLIAYYKEKGCLKVLYNNKVDQTESLKQLEGVLDDD